MKKSLFAKTDAYVLINVHCPCKIQPTNENLLVVFHSDTSNSVVSQTLASSDQDFSNRNLSDTDRHYYDYMCSITVPSLSCNVSPLNLELEVTQINEMKDNDKNK